MDRFRRIGRVAVMGIVGVIALITQADAARDAIREFPQGYKCPVHLGKVQGPDPFTFEGTGPTAKLTFVACPDRGGNDANVSIDHLVVVEKTVFNEDTNRLSYPDGVSQKYGTGFGIALRYDDFPNYPVCYGFNDDSSPYHIVDSVFDRKASVAFTRRVPFLDEFETQRPGWRLHNSSIANEDQDHDPNTSSGSLLVARKGTGTCSTSSVRIRNLVKTREYVVDFSWYVSDYDNTSPLVTLIVQD